MKPFEQAQYVSQSVEEIMAKFNMSKKDAEQWVDSLKDSIVFMNDLYQVQVRKIKPRDDNWPELIWLSIKRLDRQSIHDFRELQEIKNLIVGPQCEAIELYPAEDRLVDSANQYHLFAVLDPKFRFPFGFTDRLVLDGSGELEKDNTRQRPFKKE